MKKSKQMCVGCRDNFYNLERDGCWLFESATIMKKKKVAMDQHPPWTQLADTVLSCRRESGYVYVGENQTQ